MNTKERILDLISVKYKSRAEFERATGLPAQTVNDWERKSKSYYKIIPKLAKTLKTTSAYLLCETDNPSPVTLTSMMQANLDVRQVDIEKAQIPVYGKVAAGQGVLAYDEFDGFEVLESSSISGQVEDYFFLRVTGDSMSPEIKDGDLVLIRKQQDIDHNGQIAVVILDDSDGVLKKVFKRDSSIEMRSINPNFKTRIAGNEQVNICGVMKKLVRSY